MDLFLAFTAQKLKVITTPHNTDEAEWMNAQQMEYTFIVISFKCMEMKRV